MTKFNLLGLVLAALLFVGAGFGTSDLLPHVLKKPAIPTNPTVSTSSVPTRLSNPLESPAAPKAKPVVSCNTFPKSLYLEEASSPSDSANQCWWVNSGAVFVIRDGIASTAIGPIYQLKKWQELYAIDDPTDTDGGWYPQNIFRLVNSVRSIDMREQVYFNIDSYRLSESPNRNATNGVFLFFRYVNSQNLYLAGLRVDGTAVIKRKLNGVYETLGQVAYANPNLYNERTSPSLLPAGVWIGIAVTARNEAEGKVEINLSADLNDGRGWRTLVQTVDYPTTLENGSVLYQSGRGGIRTDFLDVKLKEYQINKI